VRRLHAQAPELLLDLLREEDLEQRLVGHVPPVRQHLQADEDGFRQPQGDRPGGGPQGGEDGPFRLRPVEEPRGVVRRPELPLLVLVPESRNPLLRHFPYALRSLRLISRAEITRSRRPRSVNVMNRALPPSVRPSA